MSYNPEPKIHNSLDSSRPYRRLLENWKDMAFQGIISAWKWFQNLLQSKFQKMTEKQKFMVFRAIFLFELHIQQRWYLTGGNSFWSFIRRKKTEHFKILKKSIMAAQKCKNILLQAALKDFWSSANPKLKKLSLPKLSLLQDHIKENAEWGLLGVTFVCKWFKMLLHSEFSENLTLKVCKPVKSMKVIKSSDHCLGHHATMTSILMNQQWLISVKCCT